MAVTTRRTTIAGLGIAAAAAGTVAATMILRKPAPLVVASPMAEPAPSLQPISAMAATDPPVPPAAASFTDEAGAAHALSDFAGKGVVLNLWATWCVPCVAELPALAELARKTAGGDLVVLPLSSDRGGAEVVRKFLAAHALALPVWLDPKGDAARAWGARGIPTTLIIDRQGRERGRLEGPVDWASDATIARLKQLIG